MLLSRLLLLPQSMMGSHQKLAPQPSLAAHPQHLLHLLLLQCLAP
jgi:hypothetical protein